MGTCYYSGNQVFVGVIIQDMSLNKTCFYCKLLCLFSKQESLSSLRFYTLCTLLLILSFLTKAFLRQLLSQVLLSPTQPSELTFTVSFTISRSNVELIYANPRNVNKQIHEFLLLCQQLNSCSVWLHLFLHTYILYWLTTPLKESKTWLSIKFYWLSGVNWLKSDSCDDELMTQVTPKIGSLL